MILTILFFGALAVMTVATLRGLYLLGRTIRERDEARWSVQQLLTQNELIIDCNATLAAQNSNLIRHNLSQSLAKTHEDDDDDDYEPYAGNIFPTE